MGYMAPEQAVGKRADHRSDLYSLGAILWECVVGRRLWSSDDVQTLLAEQLNKPPRGVREMSGDLSMPEAFDSLVARLLAINPSERPQHPVEVRDAFRALVSAVKQGTLVSAPRLKAAPPSGEVLITTRVKREAEQAAANATVDHRGGRSPAGAAALVRFEPDSGEQSEPAGLVSVPRAPALPSAAPPTRMMGKPITLELGSDPPPAAVQPPPPPSAAFAQRPLGAAAPAIPPPPLAGGIEAPPPVPRGSLPFPPFASDAAPLPPPVPSAQPPAGSAGLPPSAASSLEPGAAPPVSSLQPVVSAAPAVDFAQLGAARGLTWPPPPARIRNTALLAVVVALAAWFARDLLGPAPKKVVAPPPTIEAPAPPPKPVLADTVRPLLRSLVEGASREERVAAAQAILVHVPVDEVPAYGRAMAHLQLAETCLQKKEQLATMAAVDDARVLPVLITLAQRKRSGCGPKGKEDCLACLRTELAALIAHLETKTMIGPAAPN
jgi:hypothetical protein